MAHLWRKWYNITMKQIEITKNDAGRRLDRFLRKYLPKASLGSIYKIIRKDVKVDGKRRDEKYMLSEGEILTLYLSDEMIAELRGGTDSELEEAKTSARARRNFKIVYEDENILVADKPFGLLTHGDSSEKKNHLANQVKDYLIETGEFNPREKVFAPAPANRLDRNTTGMVLFGKTAEALKDLNKMIREGGIRKFYLTLCYGAVEEELHLTGSLSKDEKTNTVKVSDRPSSESKDIETIVRPLAVYTGKGMTVSLVEVELVTGRTHQIRAHLASAGHPLLGDYKYQTKAVTKHNLGLKNRYEINTQLLHSARLEFVECTEALEYMEGKQIETDMPESFGRILGELRMMKEF